MIDGLLIVYRKVIVFFLRFLCIAYTNIQLVWERSEAFFYDLLCLDFGLVEVALIKAYIINNLT